MVAVKHFVSVGTAAARTLFLRIERNSMRTLSQKPQERAHDNPLFYFLLGRKLLKNFDPKDALFRNEIHRHGPRDFQENHQQKRSGKPNDAASKAR